MRRARPEIRMADLQHSLGENAREALEHASRNPVTFTTEAVLGAAVQRTGLDDFGDDAFRPRLEAHLARLASDASLSALGRTMWFQHHVRNATIRLRVSDLLRRNPEIKDLQIVAPIVILGAWRSGTTHLKGLLGADERLRSLRYWEASDLASASIRQGGTDAVSCGTEPSGLVHPLVRFDLLPYLPAMFPGGPDDVIEDGILQDPDFPTKDTMSRADDYSYLATMLKVLHWKRGPNRWILKWPMFTRNLPAVLRTFPDAVIVNIHRDPVAVVQAWATAGAYIERSMRKTVDTTAVITRAIERVEGLLRTNLADRHSLSMTGIVDVLFHEFMADPFMAVGKIYKAAGLTLPRNQREHMARFLDSHPRHQHGRMVYDLRADFGVSPTDLRRRFKFYQQAFPVKIEV